MTQLGGFCNLSEQDPCFREVAGSDLELPCMYHLSTPWYQCMDQILTNRKRRVLSCRARANPFSHEE